MTLNTLRAPVPDLGSVIRRMSRDSSSLLLVAQILAAGAAFVANILAARTLDPDGRGELALLLQIAYFGSLGVLLGCDRSVVAVYAGRSSRGVTRAFVHLLLRPSATTLVAGAAILALPLDAIVSWRGRLVLAVLFMVTNAFTRAVRSIAIASDRARHYLWYEVCCETLLLGGLVALTVLGWASSALWMAVYLVAGTISAGTWLWWWGRPTSRVELDDQVHEADDVARRRRARWEGLQLLPATVAHNGTLRIDRLLLVWLASTAALGLYATVATMTELIAWPLLAYADSRLGRWRLAYEAGSLSLRTVLTAAFLYAAGAAVLLGVALHLLLVPVFGERYAAATELVLPLVAAAAVFGLSQLLVNALTAVNRGSLSSLVEMIGLGVSVLAYILLIGRFGALGAALGSLLGYSTCLVLAGLLYLRVRR